MGHPLCTSAAEAAQHRRLNRSGEPLRHPKTILVFWNLILGKARRMAIAPCRAYLSLASMDMVCVTDEIANPKQNRTVESHP
jgi:hypothetical protein